MKREGSFENLQPVEPSSTWKHGISPEILVGLYDVLSELERLRGKPLPKATDGKTYKDNMTASEMLNYALGILKNSDIWVGLPHAQLPDLAGMQERARDVMRFLTQKGLLIGKEKPITEGESVRLTRQMLKEIKVAKDSIINASSLRIELSNLLKKAEEEEKRQAEAEKKRGNKGRIIKFKKFK